MIAIQNNKKEDSLFEEIKNICISSEGDLTNIINKNLEKYSKGVYLDVIAEQISPLDDDWYTESKQLADAVYKLLQLNPNYANSIGSLRAVMRLSMFQSRYEEKYKE